MADRFDDDLNGGLPPRRPRSDQDRPQAVRPAGTRRPSGQKQGMSGWMIAGIVALCTVPVLCCVIGILGSLLLPAVQQAREAARRSQDQNNLKQIGLAGHNFHSTHGAFPPHTRPDGVNLARVPGSGSPDNPRMAWMTAMLPYIDRGDVWSRVDPSVPFDDPAAAPVYETQIPVYLSPAAAPPEGGLAPAHYAGNVQVLAEDHSGMIRDITDGISTTIYAGDVDPLNGNPAAWGDPDNLRDPADGLNVPGGFGATWPGGVQFVMGDGSVQFISESIDPAVLEALATPDGGESVTGGF
ncbi:DUF1559 domain-containing protein [Alienimonas californiensis]|uniref:DUF1559 domain-containing protein n=1 Tax=Alienimonas californiensis TaxID=2527989 RepID=A0A517P7S4_9PLAN|nr:DUF1559 domain-containing protein [Alienimonas californiensis]QDT15405.1 hypothetical protein CA12_14900 [Alienimonas californiensis]